MSCEVWEEVVVTEQEMAWEGGRGFAGVVDIDEKSE